MVVIQCTPSPCTFGVNAHVMQKCRLVKKLSRHFDDSLKKWSSGSKSGRQNINIYYMFV